MSLCWVDLDRYQVLGQMSLNLLLELIEEKAALELCLVVAGGGDDGD